jgi:CheY-like chemotaxis protein
LAIKRVLVADDDPQLRLLLIDTLQTIGYEVVGAVDGAEALEAMGREPVDLVISDISMPRMDGFELAGRVRSEHPGVGILLITGVATEESQRRAKDEGICDGYLAKPFRIDRIETMIESVMNRDSSPAPRETRRVLVVDDDPAFLEAMLDTVSALGYQAEGATDCDAALAALQREPASMVLADVSMPQMNGFDLLKVLKRQYPQIPVVMMTGHNLSEPAAETIRSSADAYLTKPFHRDEVKEVLSQFHTA